MLLMIIDVINTIFEQLISNVLWSDDDYVV